MVKIDIRTIDDDEEIDTIQFASDSDSDSGYDSAVDIRHDSTVTLESYSCITTTRHT